MAQARANLCQHQRVRYARIATVTIKTTIPREVARFWRDLLGYQVAPNHSDSVMLIDGEDGTALLIQPSNEAPDPGSIHLDLRPHSQEACVKRAQELGAVRADVGQSGSEGWVVMADPGGNLFCILESQADHEARLHVDPGTPTAVD